MDLGANDRTPWVSVVTPVYNGAAHIDECIQSVRRQSYQNWEYVIVNNRSTDDTARIAARHATEDARIRVVDNDEFMPLMANWNHALRAISEDSRYVKVLHADDLMFEDCLEKMVAVAERHPSVGLVSSYVRKGDRIVGAGFPFPDEFRAGRTVAKETLKKRYYIFGSPSSTLLLADLVRRNTRFYKEDNFHADVDVCFEVLDGADLGFVHQVLTYTREHASSQTATVANRYKTNLLENQLSVLQRYGPRLLEKSELDQLTKKLVSRYYRELARDVLRLRNRDFRTYQIRTLGRLGLRLQISSLLRALLSRWGGFFVRPKNIAHKLSRNVHRASR